MRSAVTALEAESPVKFIREQLRNSAVEVLRRHIDELHAYDNGAAFNVILNSPEMAERCFQTFRANRAEFASLLKDDAGRLVANDDEKLSCGRNLAQVVALVVQAVARRHFRTKLGIRKTVLTESKVSKEPVRRIIRSHAEGDQLFGAMRQHLLFEWQFRLIPHYVGLPLALVRLLGSRLLEFREIEQIQLMARTGQIPLRSTSREPIIARLDGPPIIQTHAPMDMDDRQRFIASVLHKVNIPLARMIRDDLNLNARELAMLLVRAHQVLGDAEFTKLGAAGPESEEAKRFAHAVQESSLATSAGLLAKEEFIKIYLAT